MMTLTYPIHLVPDFHHQSILSQSTWKWLQQLVEMMFKAVLPGGQIELGCHPCRGDCMHEVAVGRDVLPCVPYPPCQCFLNVLSRHKLGRIATW
jgi:hypothetical protein